MTVKRPHKPASVATPEEVNRVAVISQSELADTAAYTQLGPRNIPEVKIWLRVDLATDSGTLTIPDAMGGPSATQATGANKPVVGTTGNGLAKLTNAATKGLTLPVSAGVTDANYFAMGLWFRPSNVVTNSADFFNMVTGAGTSANRLSLRQDTNDMKVFVWEPGSGGLNNNRTAATDKAILLLNTWKFLSWEFSSLIATESLRSQYRDMGVVATARQAQIFGNNGTSPSGVLTTTLEPSVTGNSILFNRSTGFTNGLIGDIGPDIFFYDPRTMTDDKRVQLAQFRVPVG